MTVISETARYESVVTINASVFNLIGAQTGWIRECGRERRLVQSRQTGDEWEVMWLQEIFIYCSSDSVATLSQTAPPPTHTESDKRSLITCHRHMGRHQRRRTGGHRGGFHTDITHKLMSIPCKLHNAVRHTTRILVHLPTCLLGGSPVLKPLHSCNEAQFEPVWLWKSAAVEEDVCFEKDRCVSCQRKGTCRKCTEDVS